MKCVATLLAVLLDCNQIPESNATNLAAELLVALFDCN